MIDPKRGRVGYAARAVGVGEVRDAVAAHASGELQRLSLAVIGSVTMSFPVFWEYSFKAASKIDWNCEDGVFKEEVEDIMLVQRQDGHR